MKADAGLPIPLRECPVYQATPELVSNGAKVSDGSATYPVSRPFTGSMRSSVNFRHASACRRFAL